MDSKKTVGDKKTVSEETVEISPRTGKPIQKKYAPKKKGRPRGGNSPVIGNNGLNLDAGDNTKYMTVNMALFNMPDIDMDNVLADFEGYVKHDLSDEIKRSTKHLDEIPGIFAQFPVVDGAKEALIALQEKYELFILSTSPWNNPTALQDKQNWLKFHFGNMFHKHVIFTHQKNLCIRPGAWLVDDRPNHGAYLFGDHWLHFGRLGKYKTWNEIKDFLLKQESTIKNNP